MQKFEYIIDETMILQDYLMQKLGFSHKRIVALKQNPVGVLINGEHIRMVDTVKTGDFLTVNVESEMNISANFELSVPIIFEDEQIIVFDKPSDMPTHPSRNHTNDTLANFFCAHMKTKGETASFHPINRLDRNTCGLCVAAKNPYAAHKLSNAITKKYTGIACKNVLPKSGRIDAPIFREDFEKIKRIVDFRGQKAVTNYNVILSNEKYSLVEFSLETGRTHQIRVHMSHIGFPLAGDDMYGGDTTDFAHHMLFCSNVSFLHPTTGLYINLCINIQEKLDINTYFA